MKNFLLISILLLFFGCRTVKHCNLQKVNEQQTEVAQLYSCFKDNFNKALFKSEIKIFKNNISGLTLIKLMPDNSYRINFITELGLKIFDFELKGDQFKVIYCLEKMNKKKLIQILKEDFTLLLLENKLDDNAILYKNKTNSEKVFRFHHKNNYTYYYIDDNTKILNKIENCGYFSRRVTIGFSEFKNKFPTKIDISHHYLKLNIRLNKIDT
jgi:hypothetical protein